MAGRNPKPDAVKEASGNPGRRPLAKERSAEAAEIDEALPSVGGVPPQLSAAGKKIWQELVPDLDRVRFVRVTDRHALARYCDMLADYWSVTRELRKKKHAYETKSNHGKLRRIEPLFAVQVRLQRELTTLEDRIGLTPQARQNLMHKLAAAPVAPPEGLFGDGENGEQKAPGSGNVGDADSAVGILAAGRALH